MHTPEQESVIWSSGSQTAVPKLIPPGMRTETWLACAQPLGRCHPSPLCSEGSVGTWLEAGCHDPYSLLSVCLDNSNEMKSFFNVSMGKFGFAND